MLQGCNRQDMDSTGFPRLENDAPPHFGPYPPTGQTDHGNELIFGTQGHLWMTTWAIGAIFEILPLSRVMGGLGLTPGVEKS